MVVSARVDRTEVKTNEPFLYAISVTGIIRGTPKIQLASFKGFQVISTGQTQQIQIKEGQTRQVLVLTYTLAANAAGNHTIGPITVEYKGKQYQAQPIEVHVTDPDLSQEAQKLEGGITL